jgi:hypothetical protein
MISRSLLLLDKEASPTMGSYNSSHEQQQSISYAANQSFLSSNNSSKEQLNLSFLMREQRHPLL